VPDRLIARRGVVASGLDGRGTRLIFTVHRQKAFLGGHVREYGEHPSHDITRHWQQFGLLEEALARVLNLGQRAELSQVVPDRYGLRMSSSPLPAPDLRKTSTDSVLDRVERSLGVELDRSAMVRKRRTVGMPTVGDTWVRIEVRPLDRVGGQSWNGVEAAAAIQGVAKPAWFQGVSWYERERALMWRADETERVMAPAIKPGGILLEEPDLSEGWWATLNSSLDALAQQPTTRVAGLQPITQARIKATIDAVFPGVDVTIDEWTTNHADLAWANLTSPDCVVLDWEDWGLAPRGYDSATLLGESLAVPGLAERVSRERHKDLATRSGLVAQLYQCSKYIGAGEYAGALLEPARVLAESVLSSLRS